MDVQRIPALLRRLDRDSVARIAIDITPPLQVSIAQTAQDIIMVSIPIPPWIRRRNRDTAVRLAVVLTDLMRRECTARIAPDTIRDSPPIPASQRRFQLRERQYQRRALLFLRALFNQTK